MEKQSGVAEIVLELVLLPLTIIGAIAKGILIGLTGLIFFWML